MVNLIKENNLEKCGYLHKNNHDYGDNQQLCQDTVYIVAQHKYTSFR